MESGNSIRFGSALKVFCSVFASFRLGSFTFTHTHVKIYVIDASSSLNMFSVVRHLEYYQLLNQNSKRFPDFLLEK